MKKKAISLLLIIIMALPLFSGCLEENSNGNVIPSIEIIYPTNRMTVSGLVKIYGVSFDKDGDKTLKRVVPFHCSKYFSIIFLLCCI